MKILQVSNFFKPSFESGGVARSVYNISKSLLEQGHDVTVYTTNYSLRNVGVETNKPVNLEGLCVYYFNNLRKYFPTKVPPIPYYSPLLVRKEIKNFDVVHIHEHRTLLASIVHHYAKKNGIPYVIQSGGSVLPFFQKVALKKIYDLFLGNKILSDADAVLALTKSESKEYEFMGVSTKKIKIIPHAIDPFKYDDLSIFRSKFRTKYNITDHERIILFLGRIHKIKGIDFLLDGFNELCQERNDVKLIIVGPDDGFKPVLEQNINKFNIEDKVIFTGTLTGDEKIAALYDADMLVQTSIYERGPGSPFEAVLCGTPIIVTKNTGAGDIVDKINAGFLVDYGDVDGLKNLMTEIINNPKETQDRTEKAKNYIITNLSWENGIKEYENIYKEAINKKRG